MPMHRRAALALLGAVGVAGALAAGPVWAQAAERTVQASAVFGQLATYYRLPAAQRSHFRPVFLLSAERPGANGLQMRVSAGGATRAFSFGPNGRLLNPPTAEEIASGQILVPTALGRVSARLQLEPLLTLGPAVAAADVTRSIDQANAAIASQAGLLAFAAPRIVAVGFVAAPGATAVSVAVDGMRRVVARSGETLVYRPAQHPGAVRLEFTAAPTAAQFVD